MKQIFILLTILGSIFYYSCTRNDLTNTVFNSIVSPVIDIEGDAQLISNFLNFLDFFDETELGGSTAFDNSESYLAINSFTKFISFTVEGNHIPFDHNSFRKLLPNDYRGTTINFSFVNDSGITLNQNLYLPSSFSINAQPTFSNGSALKKSSGFNITWTTDPNPLNDKGVFIRLVYSQPLNNMIDSNLTTPTKILQFLVPDVGSYFIDPSKLIDFPECTYFEIEVTKGNYVNFIDRTKNYPTVYKDSERLVMELQQ